jgi:hypothetical protein
MTHTETPKVEIKRERASLGWTYRIYIGGMLMGAALSRDAAEKSTPRMLAIYAKAKSISGERPGRRRSD